MIFWVDEQPSPALATWISREFNVSALAIRDLGLQRANDPEIFFAARQAGATVITKDQDFVRLLERHGPPPSVLWITCGNTSNDRLRVVFSGSFAAALRTDPPGRGARRDQRRDTCATAPVRNLRSARTNSTAPP